MSSIEQVNAAPAQAAEQSNSMFHQIRAAVDGTEQVLFRIRAVAAGTGYPASAEAVARAEQSRQRLTEAATLIQGTTQGAQQYIGILG